jgi:class 3 adenylate cyclase
MQERARVVEKDDGRKLEGHAMAATSGGAVSPSLERTESKFSPLFFRSGLFRKYALLIGGLVSGALVFAGSLEMYFSYPEQKFALLQLQHEKAAGAAAVIERFSKEILAQMGWLTHAAYLDRGAALEQRRQDFHRILRQVPEITEIAFIDASGLERLAVSRVAIDELDRGTDFSARQSFTTAKSEGFFFGAVYFRDESEPYMSVGLRDQGKTPGVIIAEVNLKLVWNVISQIDLGQGGSAFLVDANGMLIAHRDISLVLRKTDLSSYSQNLLVSTDAGGSDITQLGAITTGLDGRRVLSAFAPIGLLDWLVIVESPLSEAFAPLYASLRRSAVLVILGIAISALAGLLLARRIVGPVKTLQQGAARIGAGELDQRIELHTGDELEQLAEDFNDMSVRLHESYEKVRRVSVLKRYFSPHLADLIVASADSEITASHRREVSVVFCDLRNFTAYSSLAEPHETLRVLEQFYVAVGDRVLEYEATIGYFSGDGLMAFLNDPLPCPDHTEKAVKMAQSMQADLANLLEAWNDRGVNLGFGIGIAAGLATLGHIGTRDQYHYTAIGSVVNLASRLCDIARNGETLVSGPVRNGAGNVAAFEELGERSLKGFGEPVTILRVSGLKS